MACETSAYLSKACGQLQIQQNHSAPCSEAYTENLLQASTLWHVSWLLTHQNFFFSTTYDLLCDHKAHELGNSSRILAGTRQTLPNPSSNLKYVINNIFIMNNINDTIYVTYAIFYFAISAF